MFKKIFFAFLTAFLFALAYVSESLLLGSVSGLVLSGVLVAGAWGDVKNRIGGVVAFKWKGINAARSYVIPSNPNSADQIIQRARMAQSVFIARQILASNLKVYWDPFYSRMSGFNAWISENIMKLASTTYEMINTCVMGKGTLLGVSGLDFQYNTSNGLCSISWDDNTNGSSGLATDKAFIVVSHKDGTVHACELTAETRTDTSTSKTIATGLDATRLIAWVFFTSGTGSTLAVSDSSGADGVAP